MIEDTARTTTPPRGTSFEGRKFSETQLYNMLLKTHLAHRFYEESQRYKVREKEEAEHFAQVERGTKLVSNFLLLPFIGGIAGFCMGTFAGLYDHPAGQRWKSLIDGGKMGTTVAKFALIFNVSYNLSREVAKLPQVPSAALAGSVLGGFLAMQKFKQSGFAGGLLVLSRVISSGAACAAATLIYSAVHSSAVSQQQRPHSKMFHGV